MRGQSVVSVVAVLDQQFPVCTRTVRLLACDDLHSDLALISDQIDIFASASQVVVEVLSGRIEADEEESAISFYSSRHSQPHLFALERVAVRILTGHADELT